jgi:REP element-mobilizing transposase RayT
MRTRLDAVYLEMTEESDNPDLALDRERLWFQEYEQYLHKTQLGPFWLQEDRVAALVADAFHHFDSQRYRLDSFCVMPNHVHVVLMPLPTTEEGMQALLKGKLVKNLDGDLGYLAEDEHGVRQFHLVTFHSLASIMHSIKRHTATKANLLLGRTGSFWQEESYDHFTRDHEEWLRTNRYVLHNPVKAGLVTEWKQWPWSWRRDEA